MEPLIEVKDVAVTYQVRQGASQTLKETVINSIKRKRHDIDVEALRGVSFEVKPGEVLAVVGRNGAGKSTLLKLLAQVLPPTSGQVIVRGSVAPMIALGAGFNSELTGRENVIFYGALLGRKPKDMAERVAEIAEWADLTEAIDLPLRTYSSGMVARLAFAVATDTKSEVVLIDEILSVGDAEFQKKSEERLAQMFKRDSAVILVSHSEGDIRRLATKAIWIDRGRSRAYGDVETVLGAYLNA